MRKRRSGKLLLGVCGGIADHYGVDVLYIRLAFVIALVWFGVGIIPYLLLWLIMD